MFLPEVGRTSGRNGDAGSAVFRRDGGWAATPRLNAATTTTIAVITSLMGFSGRPWDAKILPPASHSITLLGHSLVHPPERAHPEPCERNREAYGEHQPPRSGGMAGLVLPVLANAGHGPDRSHRQEGESGHFQPELV